MTKSRRKESGPALEPDSIELDDIEILEIVGMDEDAPAPGIGAESEQEDDNEILLSFDEDADAGVAIREGKDLPERPGGPAAADQDQLLRLQADFDNFKKRVDREWISRERHVAAGLVTRMLPILDNFERAVSTEHALGVDRAFRDGVGLIFRQLLDELRKEGLRAIDSLGEPFNPKLHEAVATDSQSDLPPNTVVEELQRGYLLHDRLLRPSLVKVTVDTTEGAQFETDGEE
jgi:molecular chaperone GrpE